MSDLLLRRWLPLAGLVLFAGLAVYLVRPPRPVLAGAPATAFSAERALREVAVVARRPHSPGTPANAAVRDYLLRRCRALGLTATVQDTVAVAPEWGIGGRVQNVVARLPGRLPGAPAVLVLTHYDSQPHTPGATDDGAGVGAALETIRALRAGPPLAHDVIWVFTDGEEAGLLGARAYAADTARLRQEVGVVLNFEARGNAGPSMLFEVSDHNGWLLREFARAAPNPVGSSLAYELYRYLPNNTDFTVFRQAGLPGLNFAFTGGYSYYHSPADTPAHLDLGSLQHHGAYMLALVRHFGTITLAHDSKEPDYTFFNPLSTWLVRYNADWNAMLNILAGALLLAAIVWARRQRQVRLRGLLGGALAWLGALVVVLALGWGLQRLVWAAYPQYAAFYDHTFYNVSAYHLALVALGVAGFAAYYGWLSRWLRPDSLAGGLLLVVALLQVLIQTKARTSGFLLGFPLLFGALAWLLRLASTRRPLRRSLGDARPPAVPIGALGWLLALPVVAILGPLLAALLVVAGLGPLLLPALALLALLLGLLLPVLLPTLGRAAGPGRGWVVPALAGVVLLGALAVGHATSQPTAEKPQQTHMYYLLDTDQKQAYWLSAGARPDAWNRQFFLASSFAPVPTLFPGSAQAVLHQAAPRLALAAPLVTVVSDGATAGGRWLRLLVRPNRAGVASLRFTLATKGLRQVQLASHPLALSDAAGPYASFSFYAPGTAGVFLDLETAAPGPISLTVTDRSLGLPQLPGLRPLPPTFVAAPGDNSFTTQVRKRFRL